MIKPDVVSYLRSTLAQYPLGSLRRQLKEEGVSDPDFNDSFKAALRSPAAPGENPTRMNLTLLAVGVVATLAAAVFIAQWFGLGQTPGALSTAPGESAFVGRTGYIIHLPKNYAAFVSFKDAQKTVEVVHFCRAGTDPTNFLHEGLFGPLGIVRLEVRPAPFPSNITGQERLSQIVSSQHAARGEKFTLAPLQVSSLHGLEIRIELPQPSWEAYILGDRALYHFVAGQDDENFRDILNSLREPTAETL